MEKAAKTSEKDMAVYEALTTAFGKDGIPALIIENAIPEIESEANQILSRLTANRTHVAIESLRDLKKGGTRETLDIKISDELGERQYELYSGGEAFRINFALRIALAKLFGQKGGDASSNAHPGRRLWDAGYRRPGTSDRGNSGHQPGLRQSPDHYPRR